MKQTPIHHGYNHDLLKAIPRDARRVIEVGCSSGAFAKAYRALNPECEYVGTEIDPDYAEIARQHCSRVLVGNIEHMLDEILSSEDPYACWIFGDVLEHLYDPWRILSRIATALPSNGVIVACIPNMQHWSMQIRMNHGDLRYEDAGLLDRTHIRWFTRATIMGMFASSGLQIVELAGRVFDEPQRNAVLPLLRTLAQATGANPDQAEMDAKPLQYIVKARPLAKV